MLAIVSWYVIIVVHFLDGDMLDRALDIEHPGSFTIG